MPRPTGSFKSFLSVLGTGVLSILLSGVAEAFVRVSPPIVEIYAAPGESVSGRLNVSNNKNYTMSVNMEVKDWWNENTGLPAPNCSEWLRFKAKQGMKLNPGQEKSVKYRVDVPKNAQGEMMAMIFFNIESTRDPSGNPTVRTIEMRHGIPIYVIVKGTEKISALRENIGASFERNVSSGPIEFSITFKNAGNVHIRPAGSVSILKEGSVLDTFSLASGWPILPSQKHPYYATSSKSGWPAGEYQAAFNLSAGTQESVFGKYSVYQSTLPFRVTPTGKVELINP